MKNRYLYRLKAHEVITNELPFIVIVFFLLIPHCGEMAYHLFVHEGDYGVIKILSYASELIQCLALSLAIAYVLASLVNITRSRLLRIIFYAFFIFLMGMRLFLRWHFYMEFGPLLLTLLTETNTREVDGFISAFILAPNSIKVYLSVISVSVAVYASEFLYRKYVQSLVAKFKYLHTLSIPIVIVCLCSLFYAPFWYLPLFRCRTVEEVSEWYWKTYSRDYIVTQFIYSFYDVRLAKNDYNQAINSTDKIANENVYINNKDSINIIVVIGESYIKSHAQVYGYALPTTPRMQAEKDNGNLFLLNNVVTPYNNTTKVLQDMFCCNSMLDGEAWQDYPIFPAVMKKAGYDVYYWDNQKVIKNDASSFDMSYFLYNPNVCERAYTFMNEKVFRYDDELITDFETTNPICQKTHNLIMFHLNGQHMDAAFQYPHIPKFEKFDAKSISRRDSYLTENKKTKIAEYDNATLYNDSVMAHIFNIYRNTNSILIYFSDHGDEVYDFRNQYGRISNDNSKEYLQYEFCIPAIIWMSDKYKAQHSEMVQAVLDAYNKPWMLDNLCQVIFYWGGVQTRYYHSVRNLLSPDYHVQKRKLGNGLVYDEIISIK